MRTTFHGSSLATLLPGHQDSVPNSASRKSGRGTSCLELGSSVKRMIISKFNGGQIQQLRNLRGNMVAWNAKVCAPLQLRQASNGKNAT